MLSGITPINTIIPIGQTGLAGTNPSAGTALQDFGQLLDKAINHLGTTEATANNAITRLAAGEDVELHQVMLAMQEADISFQMATQVRNKLVDAYQEIMRMQV